MIIYIASYPRSGNSLTQRTIITYFERPITALNPKSRKADFFANGRAYFIKNWRYNVQPTSDTPKNGIRRLDPEDGRGNSPGVRSPLFF